jgi:hypothetical protein
VGAHGFLLPAQVHVRWADEALGKMIAVLQAMPLEQEVALLADPATRQVTYATQNLATLFGFGKRDILAKKLTLQDVLPALKEDEDSNRHEVAWAELHRPKGLRCEAAHAATEQRFHVQAFSRFVPVFETGFLYLRLEVSQSEATHEGRDADGIADAEDAPIQDAEVPISRPGSRSSNRSNRSKRSRASKASSRAREAEDAPADSPRTRLPARSSSSSFRTRDARPPLPPQPLSPRTDRDRARAALGALRAASADLYSLAGSPHLREYPQLQPVAAAPIPYAVRSPSPVEPDVTAFIASYSEASVPHSAHGHSTDASMRGVDPAFAATATVTNASSPRASHDGMLSEAHRPSSDQSSDPALSRSASFNQSIPDRLGDLARSPFAVPDPPRSPREPSLPSLPPAAITLAHLQASIAERDAAAPMVRDKSGVEVSVGTVKQRKRRQLAKSRYRLLKAIDNDNRAMVRRLRQANVYGVLLLVLVAALLVADHLVAAPELTRTQTLLQATHDASQRNTLAMEATYHLAVWRAMYTTPGGAAELTQIFYKPLSKTPASYFPVMASYETRARSAFQELQRLNAVDDRSTTSAELKRIRQQNVFPVELASDAPGGSVQELVPVTVVGAYLVSLGQLSLYTKHTSSVHDIGYIFTIVNSLTGNLKQAFDAVTWLTVAELEDATDALFTRTLIFFVATIALILAGGVFLIAPAAAHAERSKLRILHIYRSVPTAAIRRFRRSAKHIFDAVSGDKSAAQDEDDPADGAASTFTTLSAPGDKDATARRYSTARGHAAGDWESGRGPRSPAPQSREHLVRVEAAGGDRGGDGKVSLLSLKGALVNVFVLLAVASVFYAVLLVSAADAADKMGQAARVIAVANERSYNYQFALSFALQNIATSKDLLATINPNDPMLKGPEYYEGSAAALAAGREASFATSFGGALGIREPLNDELQVHLLYGDLCSLSVEHAYELLPALREQTQVFRDCEVLEDKVMEHGLHAMISQFDDELGPLTTERYSLGIAQMLYPGFPISSPLTPEEMYGAVTTFNRLNQLFNDYIYPILQLSTAIYLDYSTRYAEQVQTTRLVIVVLYPFVLLAFYQLLYKKLMTDLSRAAAASNAVMLLLPETIVKHVKPAQGYIADNLAKD